MNSLGVTELSRGPASAATLTALLDSPEIGQLIEALEATRWTGRPGHPIRTMVGLALAKSLYALPTWTRTVALVADHWRLQRALGCEGDPPSQWSAYRFAAKLRENNDALQRCLDSVVEGLKAKLPLYGRDLAIDASDMPAYANGQRYVSKNSEVERNWHTDPDASWGHRSAVSTRRGGGFFGYRLHATVCTATDLPVAWTVETAKAHETRFVADLLDTSKRRGAMAATAALDRGYDIQRIHDECMERDCLPLIPLKQTPDVKRGDDQPPCCEHGVWTFAGADRKRGATKWRCPSGECKPASTWIAASRLHPLIPRESKRFKAGYRKRAAVEREFGATEDHMGTRPAPRSRAGPSPTPRRPDDSYEAGLRTGEAASSLCGSSVPARKHPSRITAGCHSIPRSSSSAVTPSTPLSLMRVSSRGSLRPVSQRLIAVR